MTKLQRVVLVCRGIRACVRITVVVVVRTSRFAGPILLGAVLVVDDLLTHALARRAAIEPATAEQTPQAASTDADPVDDTPAADPADQPRPRQYATGGAL